MGGAASLFRNKSNPPAPAATIAATSNGLAGLNEPYQSTPTNQVSFNVIV